jgi:nitrate reductase NapE component
MSNQEQQTSPESSAPADEAPEARERATDAIVAKPAKGNRKKRKVLKFILLTFAIFIIALVLVAGWFGFVPGLSDLFGARSPKDLGVRWTDSDFISYRVKTGTVFKDFAEAPDNPLRSGKKTIFADPTTVDNLTIAQEEITAAINSIDWAWLPADRVQVKLNEDAIEVSGTIKMDHMADFVRFIGGVGYAESDVSKAVDWGKRFVDGAPFYARGSATVVNNQLSLDLQSLQIGRYSTPLSIASNVVLTGGSNGLKNTQYLDITSAKVGNGVLTISGTYPKTIYVRH